MPITFLNDPARWDHARQLVVQEGLSYADAAARAGVPLRTLERRAAQEGWQKLREEAQNYAAKVGLLKTKLLNIAIETGKAQDAHAWASVEAKWPEHRYAGGAADPAVKREVYIQALEHMVLWLNEHDPEAMAALQPHLKALTAAWEERIHGR